MGGGQSSQSGREISALNERGNALQRITDLHNTRIGNVEGQQTRMAGEIGHLQGQMAQEAGAKAMAVQNKAELANVKGQVSTNSTAIRGLHQGLSAVEQRTAASETAINYLTTDVQKHDGQIQNLQQVTAATDSRLAVLAESSRKFAEITDKTLDTHNTRIQEGEKTLVNHESRVGNLETGLTRTQDDLAKTNENLGTLNANFEGRVAKTNAYMEVATKIAENHEVRLRDTESTVVEEKTKTAHLQKEMEVAQTQIRNTDIAVGDVRQQIGRMAGETGLFMETAGAMIREHEGHITENRVKIAVQETKTGNMEGTLARTQDQINQSTTEVGNFKEKLGFNQGSIQGLMRDLDHYKKIVDDLVTVTAVANAENTSLKQDMRDMKNRYEVDMREIQVHTKTMQENYERRIASLEAKIDKYKE